jgi:DNA-binding GntR family transcriptional regulator
MDSAFFSPLAPFEPVLRGPDSNWNPGPNDRSFRSERINEIRCDLLVDRDAANTKLGLIDVNGFVSERALAEHKGGSRPPTRDALAALVARRVLSVVPGRGYEVALLTKNVIERNKLAGYDSVNGLRTELTRTANAAIESISTSASSQKERQSILGEAKAQLECAVNKSHSNRSGERGEAVFHTTETIGLIGSAAGLRWGADTLRSGLDILEISIRWNRDQKDDEVFELPQVVKRVESCRTLLDALTAKEVASETACGAFSNYLDDRVRELSSAIDEDSVAYYRPSKRRKVAQG